MAFALMATLPVFSDHLVNSSVLIFGSCARRASISRTASLRRRRMAQARNAPLIARLRSPAGTLRRRSQVSSHDINQRAVRYFTAAMPYGPTQYRLVTTTLRHIGARQPQCRLHGPRPPLQLAGRDRDDRTSYPIFQTAGRDSAGRKGPAPTSLLQRKIPLMFQLKRT
jgi:hypothetical protein